MTTPLTVELDVHFDQRGKGARKVIQEGPNPAHVTSRGRLPRVTRWMALAIRFQQLLQQGEIANYAELARLGHVSRARITQIMNLLLLAPDIQEELLFLPRIKQGRDPITLKMLVSIALEPLWEEQRKHGKTRGKK